MSAQGVSVEYLAAGANRQAAGADWSRRGLVAFGADVNVALWRPAAGRTLRPGESPAGVEALLSGHAAGVRAVRFLPQADADAAAYLVTGADDAALVVWTSDDAHGRAWRLLHSCPAAHGAAVNHIAALRPEARRPRWIVATGAADAAIRLWTFAAATHRLEPLQTIATAPKFFPLALSLTVLRGDAGGTLVLAAAGTSDAIQVLTADDAAAADADAAPPPRFRLQATLSGHEGWVRSLSFASESDDPGSDVLLASASQDKYVRIWRLRRGRGLPALAASATGPPAGASLPGESPSNKAYWLEAPGGRHVSVTFEALLLGHEDWIYSAAWHRHADGRLQLLSASADNSLAVWEADASSGIWVSRARLGDISREKGATTATGSTGGFWTALWSPDGTSVACLGRTGSWRTWRHDAADDAWRPCVAVSGHTRPVTGVAWSRSSAHLLSTSLDQTTRLHARWVEPGANTWHEMSRPQIHGYDLNCIDSLGDSRFVSGADEKLLRVFGQPKAVATLLRRLAGADAADAADDQHAADAADMPVLGLSNKAMDAVDDRPGTLPADGVDGGAADPASAVKKRCHLDTSHPPLEETLSRHTLWPETEKLYGHGYEISCLAASHDGKLIASACKASSANHAVIRLFETQCWTELRPPLTAHALTATRLRFSPDDQHLLSVGRDRQWVVFERAAREPPTYRLLQANPKGHGRMILDAAWAPSEARLFATAGRDKQVRIWASEPADGGGPPRFALAAALACAAPATSIDFLPRRVGGRFLLAVGTEAGRLSLCLVEEDGRAISELQPPPE